MNAGKRSGRRPKFGLSYWANHPMPWKTAQRYVPLDKWMRAVAIPHTDYTVCVIHTPYGPIPVRAQ